MPNWHTVIAYTLASRAVMEIKGQRMPSFSPKKLHSFVKKHESVPEIALKMTEKKITKQQWEDWLSKNSVMYKDLIEEHILQDDTPHEKTYADGGPSYKDNRIILDMLISPMYRTGAVDVHKFTLGEAEKRLGSKIHSGALIMLGWLAGIKIEKDTVVPRDTLFVFSRDEVKEKMRKVDEATKTKVEEWKSNYAETRTAFTEFYKKFPDGIPEIRVDDRQIAPRGDNKITARMSVAFKRTNKKYAFLVAALKDYPGDCAGL